MAIPETIVPLLGQVRDGTLGRNAPLAFWQLERGERILDGFMALAPLLQLSDIDLKSLPKGYELIARLFHWEAECQFDGWAAFGNVYEPDFQRICDLFSEVGLGAEAASLRSQMEAFALNPDNTEVLNHAAESTRHALSTDLDRLEFLTQYLCDNAEVLLGERA